MYRGIKYVLAFIATLTTFVDVSDAQVQQSGGSTRRHAPMYCGPAVICDSGPALGGASGTGLSELGITNTGTPFCVTDGPTTGPYYQLCLGATATVNNTTGAFITYNAYNGAVNRGLTVNINGANYAFPGTGLGNVIGPLTTTIGYVPEWNSTNGTILSAGNPNGAFWSNVGSPVIDRMGDRLILGLQTNLYDGTNVNCSVNCTWVGSPNTYGGILRYLEVNAQMIDYSQNGEMAVTFASRTSDTINGCCSMAVAAISQNNNTNFPQPSWLYYGTAIRNISAGDTHASELHITNLGNDQPTSPYGPVNGGTPNGGQGLTWGDQVFCGSEVPSTLPCTAAFNVGSGSPLVNNTFRTGIVVSNGSVSFTSDHGNEAMSMPSGYSVVWYEPTTSTVGAFVQSIITDSSDRMSLIFGQGGNLYLSGANFAALVVNPNVGNAGQVTFASFNTNKFSIGKDSSDNFFINQGNVSKLTIVGGQINVGNSAANDVVNLAGIVTNAVTPANFVANKTIQLRINGTNYFIPALPTGW